MFRTFAFASLAVALLGGTALAADPGAAAQENAAGKVALMGSSSAAQGLQAASCAHRWTLAQELGGSKPTTDFDHPSGTTGDPGGDGWTISQKLGGSKPSGDFYHPSGTTGDTGGHGWTISQEIGGSKPSGDFYHPSGTCPD
jgi:hypothetical protein